MTESVAGPKFHMLVMTAFAALALLLAAVGIGGIVSYSVAQRTHEIGVRIALGASRWLVQRMIVGLALGLALVGIAIGLAASAAFTRLLTGLLFEIKPVDTPTFVTVAALLFAIATVASWLPARRVVRIDPQTALRAE